MVTVTLQVSSRDGSIDADRTVDWPAVPRAGDYVHATDMPVKVKKVTWFVDGTAFVELARMAERDMVRLPDYGWSVMGLETANATP